jgi:hypothetical protein
MTIPIVSRKMRPQRLTVGHRDRRNPRCGFELINAALRCRLVNRDGWLSVIARSAATEAIQSCFVALDCFASLAMTVTLRKMPKNPTQLWIT